ncbi:MAG: hypothetical protein JF622_02005 [Terrabacter sp.]|nr:hypothetical protein [Terrabacter sp.]
MSDVNGLVMVEGRPESGRIAIAEDLARWLAGEQVAVEHRSEGHADHPVDVDHVVVLDTAQLLALAAESAETSRALLGAAEQHGDALVDAVRAHRPVVVYLDDDREIGSSRQGRRRELDLVVLAGLDVPTLVVPVGDGLRDDHTAAVRDFVADHLGLAGRGDSQQVA